LICWFRQEEDDSQPGGKALEAGNILVLIPAYNEAQRIAPVINGAAAHLPVLVIDDGSQDGTVQVAEEHNAQVVQQIPNQGKGAALRLGFQAALDGEYEAVITIDADGQHDPDEIPAFMALFEEQKPDLIIGRRDFKQIPPVRRLANSLGRWSFSWAVGQPIPDNQSGYRLLSRRMMEAVLDSQESGFEFEVEMIVTCIQRGYNLAWVPIKTIYRDEGSHIHPLKHTLEFTRMVLQTRRRMQGGEK
jgi:glycosyltransferase involved in cell wall biosynthesis